MPLFQLGAEVEHLDSNQRNSNLILFFANLAGKLKYVFKTHWLGLLLAIGSNNWDALKFVRQRNKDTPSAVSYRAAL